MVGGGGIDPCSCRPCIAQVHLQHKGEAGGVGENIGPGTTRHGLKLQLCCLLWMSDRAVDKMLAQQGHETCRRQGKRKHSEDDGLTYKYEQISMSYSESNFN